MTASTLWTSSTSSGSPGREERDVALVVEEAGRRPEADERGGVQSRDERDGVEDPDHREAPTTDDDLDPAAGPGDPEPAGGRSQDDGGVPGRRVVEEHAVGEVAPTVAVSDGSAASVVRPFVSALGISSERNTGASTAPTADTASTGPIRPTIDRAVSGNVASSPKIDWPGETVSRLVPRRSSDERRSALLDSEIASTATMAAIPIAMPSADRAALSLRAERPTAPTRSVAGREPARCELRHAFVSSSTSPSRSSIRRGMDSASSRSWVITTTVVPPAFRSRRSDTTPGPIACRGSPWARRRRGSAGAPIARATATAGAPARELVRRVLEPVRETDLAERLLGPGAAFAQGTSVEQPVCDVLARRASVEEEELLEHEADRACPERRERAIGELRGDVTVDSDRPGGRTLERAEDVEQGRLAGAGRPDDRELALRW